MNYANIRTVYLRYKKIELGKPKGLKWILKVEVSEMFALGNYIGNGINIKILQRCEIILKSQLAQLNDYLK